MKRRHGFLIAVVLAAAAVAGTFAALQTTNLGPAAATSSPREIARADAALDRQEAQLRRAAKRRPPKLPDAPTAVSVAPTPSPVPAPASVPAVAASASGQDSGHGRGDDDFNDDFRDDDSDDDDEEDDGDREDDGDDEDGFDD